MSAEKKDNLFHLTTGNDEPETVEGRAEAVARAKELSQDRNQRVNLERADGMVSMQFSDGILETYVCETREKKPSRRKADAESTDEQNTDTAEEATSEATEETVQAEETV